MEYTQHALNIAYQRGLDGKSSPCSGELYLEWERGYKIYKRRFESNNMKKVEINYLGFDFYINSGCGIARTLYNIVPTGSPAPSDGYYNRRYIEKIKGVKFPDRYQPTLHGMSETYLTDMEP